MIRTILNSVNRNYDEPTVYPVGLATVKTYLGIGSTIHDSLLTSLIESSTKLVEDYAKIAILNQEINANFDSINQDTRLPISFYKDIVSVKDENGLDVIYQISKGSNPLLKLTSLNFVEVVYSAGMDTVPQDLIYCIIKSIGEDFEYRTSISLNSSNLLPNNWRQVALKYRSSWLM
jgi:hypothetical protein